MKVVGTWAGMFTAAIRRVIEALITKVAACIGLNVVSLMGLTTQAVSPGFSLLESSTNSGKIDFSIRRCVARHRVTGIL